MFLHRNRLFLSVVVSLALSAPAFANRGVTAEDYLALHFPSDAHISPDGKQVAYVVTVIDQQRNRRVSSIWLVDVDGRSAPRRLTVEGVNSNAPRWSPDGTALAFLSTRNAAAGESAGSSGAAA